MKEPGRKFVCIHGHFYQPPRENAWLEIIEVQDSAHPFHDWNERISAECYAPNAASRILDEKRIIRRIVNNYAKISFNFGPTLLSWMQNYDPETYQAVLEADRASLEIFEGHGSALAQVYNHVIMPLATREDKETQIIWGIRDFEHRFKRKPAGMWLAETAVDTETLELLADNEIQFTILAPRQARAVRKAGATQWTPVNEQTVDTRKAYRVALPNKKSIIVFFYDGEVSQAIAFNGLLEDGKRFAESLLARFQHGDARNQLVNVATDGETYGHHHRHGDMALAFCLDYIEKNPDVELANYPYFLSQTETTHEAQIHENSSWSCVHGVERWRENCGCNSGKPGYHQLWRKPLREALDWLRTTVADLYASEGSRLLRDPRRARNEYIGVILNRNEETINDFLQTHARPDAEITRVTRLMEIQRNAMLMYTSCGWFFDEVSGIETTQVMQYACRVIQLANQIGNVNLEPEFKRLLEKTPSNLPAYQHAGNVYEKLVLPSKTNLTRVGMHYAVSSIFEEEPESLPLFNYAATNEFFLKKQAGEQVLVLGITRVRSLVTLSEKKFAFAVVCIGVHNIIGNISLDMEADKFASMQYRITGAFDDGRIGDVIGIMQTYFGPDKYTIWQLFTDEKRKVLDLIAQKSLESLEASLRRTYNRDYPLVNALANNGIPIPSAYRSTFEYILNADLADAFEGDRIHIKALERIAAEMSKWHLKVEDVDKVARMAAEAVFKELKKISSEARNVKRLQRLNRLFPVLQKFNPRVPVHAHLYKCQNLYFEMSVANGKNGAPAEDPAWQEQFDLMGDNLMVKVH
jgi:alpha-amylase/alpha-mannosidase (GH57 family)